MNKPFFIRTAMKGDIAAIHLLLVETWHATYDATMGVERVRELTSRWHSKDAMLNRLDIPNSEFVVADNGEQIGGMAFATSEEKRIKLQQLYVLPVFQGRKIGMQLLAEIENSFPECNHIGLEVERDNRQAVDFYLANGFAITGESAHCMEEGSNIPTLLMEKPVMYLS